MATGVDVIPEWLLQVRHTPIHHRSSLVAHQISSKFASLGGPHMQLWTYNIKDIRHEKANSLIKTLIGNFTSKVK